MNSLAAWDDYIDSKTMTVWQEYYTRVREVISCRPTKIIHTSFWKLLEACVNCLKFLASSVRVQHFVFGALSVLKHFAALACVVVCV